jgi:Phosphoenolpyruvate carboxykinase
MNKIGVRRAFGARQSLIINLKLADAHKRRQVLAKKGLASIPKRFYSLTNNWNSDPRIPRALLEKYMEAYEEKDAHIAENGAFVAYSGVETGRSPKDKRIVKARTRV